MNGLFKLASNILFASFFSLQILAQHPDNDTSEWAYEAIHIPVSEDVEFNGKPVVVAVVDDAFRLSHKELKNGKLQYFQSALTPIIVSPEQSAVIPLVPEFIRPQEKESTEADRLYAQVQRMAGPAQNVFDRNFFNLFMGSRRKAKPDGFIRLLFYLF